MARLVHEIHINAPVDEVWAVLADLEAVQHYNPMVASARYVSDTRQGVGASRLCEFRPGGSAKERVTEWKPREAVAMEAVEHPWPMQGLRWRNAMARVDGGTRLTQVLEYEFMGDDASAAAMEAQWGQGMTAIFEALKGYVENNAQRKR